MAELIKRCIRILYISRKPTPEEFEKVAKVTSLGMAIFGIIGFIISFLFGLVR
ncbi:MAG: protein translocase SEC61 complex subunit gamma [Candidatus ainarchaeum sp.]|nr:protein translocase SEC61 complex subunit gamma [Candidatus ainarchaeum sp.]